MGGNILITGGAGFIGSSLAWRLLEKGYSVTVLDNLSVQVHGKDPQVTSPYFTKVKNEVKFIHGTVLDRNNWLKSIEDVNTIVHFAAETGTGQSMYEIARYSDVNISGTALMLDILTNKRHKVVKVLVASSRAIYGEGRYHCPECGIVYPLQRSVNDMDAGLFETRCPECSGMVKLTATDEGSLLHPTSVYGITKQTQEQMVMTVTKALGIAGVALRYQNVYGPGQSLINPYTGILSIFSTQIRNGNSINIFEDGLESRDFVFIDDTVDATILAIENENANNQVFNVGTGIPVSVMDVAIELMKKYGRQSETEVSGNYRIGDIRHNYADISKIRSTLGFEPRVTFNEGIEKFTDWVKNQPSGNINLDNSLEEMKVRNLFK